MDKPTFDAAVDQLLVQFGGSLTSGRRTTKRTLAVGGFDGDPHTWGLGVDVVWDQIPALWEPSPMLVNEQGPTAFAHTIYALRLHLIREKDHDHLQPIDFPAGPVKTYGGVTRS